MKRTALLISAGALAAFLGAAGAVADITAASGQVTSPPTTTDLTLGNSQSLDLQWLDEQQWLVLPSDLTVDMKYGYVDSLGTWTKGVDPYKPKIIPAGEVVGSHLIHFDPPGATLDDIKSATGTFTFDYPILGFIVTTQSLRDSDAALGNPSYTYDAVEQRKLDNGDYITYSNANPCTLTVHMLSSGGMNELRVVTLVPVPGAALLGAMGLGLVGWWKRRR